MEAASRHIAQLEEKLFKLKQVGRDLQRVKEEKQLLRKSPERRIGQVLLAPYRLPQRLIRALVSRRRRPSAVTAYQRWFEQHRATAEQLALMRSDSRGFSLKPLVSVIMPVFNTPVPWLDQAIGSVVAQAYENWELLLVDDNSTDETLARYLDTAVARDSRIRLFRLATNGGISTALNHGVEQARGEWLGFLDHDDVLEPDALFHTVSLLQRFPDADIVYSDEDKLGESGLERPVLKPDWSPDLFLSSNYISHFVTVRSELVRSVGAFRPEFDGAQDYDLLFRMIERTQRIHHVPRVLYHWRRSASSSAIDVRQKPGQLDAARRAVEDHLQRTQVKGRVAIDWPTHTFWVQRELRAARPVSVIIACTAATQSLARCLQSVSQTAYPDYEIVLVGNVRELRKQGDALNSFRARVLHYDGALTRPAMNNFAAAQTRNPWLLFLQPDLEPVDAEWLGVMAEQLQRAEVGAVGPLVLAPDRTIEHAGIVLGPSRIAQPAFRGFSIEDTAVLKQAGVMRDCSAVTGACILTRREIFAQVGGFDEGLPRAFYDVDLCLKLRRAGYLIVYTPFARLYRRDSPAESSPATSPEASIMQERWGEALQRDPYYNPNLSRERGDFALGN